MKDMTVGQLALIVFMPLLLLPIIIVLLKIFQAVVGRLFAVSERYQSSIAQKRDFKDLIAGRIMNTRPSAVARFVAELTVGLILFSTFWRVFSLPLYLFVETKGELPLLLQVPLLIILVAVPLVFAILMTIKLLKIVNKNL